jgi:hypothetical protein
MFSSYDKERRRKRSTLVFEAAEHYLRAVRTESAAHAVALGDDLGLLVAGVGDRQSLDMLAALGALRPSERERYRGEVDAVAPGHRWVSFGIEVDGQHLTVAAITKSTIDRDEMTASLFRIFRGRSDYSTAA